MSNMQNLQDANQYYYRGLILKKCCNERSFNKPYVTVINPKIRFPDGKQAHCHAGTEHFARQIVDYYINLDRYNQMYKKVNRSLRDKALCLTGIQVKITH
jgi:hypothetical protein